MAVFFVLLAAVVILTYIWFQYKFTYWSRKGVNGPKPVFPYGNIRDALRRKDQFFQPYCDSYVKFKNLPYVGMYSFYRPVLCVNDLEMAKHILISDFDHFQSRGIYSGGRNDPLAENLFNISGKPWRQLRLKMSPTFTSGKLRTMYPFVEGVANKARSYADMLYSKGKSIDFSEFYERYAMEIIANVGFGVECNGLTNPQSEFDCCGREYFEIKSLYWSIIRAFAFIAPDLFSKLRIRRISRKVENFFYGLVKETVSYRQKHNYKRNDFLQTLIDLMNGQIVSENGDIKRVHDFPFSMNDVAANAMLYMIAGYETSAKTGQFAAYQLALNPHIQTKVRDEIDRVLAKYDGECTYEAQNEMIYLNMVLDETMRLYPALRAIFRRCNKPYKLPNSDVVIEEGTLVFVPIQAIHMDPQFYPEPEKFDPERFAPEKKAKFHPCQWMPFGEGPRKCLGARQGYIQSKLALIKMLQKYELVLDERTAVPLKLKTSCLVWAAEGGVWLKLRELNNNGLTS
ncbi:probable cytochrome P450 6a13 [Achroia grisella]|uniref:probable cytochrome P450 6a13 n=1 Tax=Achroia grisella TaxID=688607 RepID=UPI0027D22097|nr:probable cytochrome P450 6a13 [Achroia grisella]